jgi:hypothetical protein
MFEIELSIISDYFKVGLRLNYFDTSSQLVDILFSIFFSFYDCPLSKSKPKPLKVFDEYRTSLGTEDCFEQSENRFFSIPAIEIVFIKSSATCGLKVATTLDKSVSLLNLDSFKVENDDGGGIDYPLGIFLFGYSEIGCLLSLGFFQLYVSLKERLNKDLTLPLLCKSGFELTVLM